MHDRDRSGALASLSSVAKIPYKDCLDGISNTFCLVPSALGKGDNQPTNLAVLLDGYFSHNAHHININVLNRSLLEDAHLHPEKYPTLTIRVSGYAVRFNQLTSEQREEVLKRTMHGSTYSVSKVTSFPKTTCDCTITDDFTSSDIELLNTPSHWSPNTIGSVHSIETFTTADGPGIRTLVFLQGCAKRCIYCSNPETQCIIDPKTCKEVAMEDTDIVNVVERYYDYLRPNNGGVTFSGGEPLLQPNFVQAVFEKVQDIGLTTCLDTSGHGNPKMWNQVLPSTDYVMLCLKAMDSALAFEISRVSEESAERAKDFARFIHDRYKDIKLSIRWVLLEGMTDTDEELDALVNFSKELIPTLTHIELLPFHQLGKDKYEHLNLPYPLSNLDEYPHSKAMEVKEKLEKSGLIVVL
jgi:pyruvate formate lyase activating enzyme